MLNTVFYRVISQAGSVIKPYEASAPSVLSNLPTGVTQYGGATLRLQSSLLTSSLSNAQTGFFADVQVGLFSLLSFFLLHFVFCRIFLF